MKVKLVFSLLLFLAIHSILFSKDIDSLERLLDKTKSERVKASILNQISREYLQNSSPKSLGYALKALSIAYSNNQTTEVIASFNNIGEYYINQGNPDSAEIYLLKALPIATKVNDLKMVAEIYNNLGFALSQSNQLRAMEYYNKAIATNKSAQLNRETSIALNNLGNLKCQMGDYYGSLAAFTEALHFDSLTNNPINIAFTLNSIGVIYHYLGNYYKTLEYYLLSLKTYEKINHQQYIGVMYHNIGCVYLDYKDYDKALENYNKAIEIKAKQKDRRSSAYSLTKMAIIYYETNKIAEAKKLAEKAREIFIEFKNINGLGEVLLYLGMIEFANKKLAKSKQFLNETISIATQLNSKPLLAKSYYQLGKIMCKEGYTNDGIKHINKGLAISKSIRLLKLQKDIEKDLADLYIDSHLYKESIPHLMEYISINDSLYATDTKKIVLEMGAKYETSRKELQLQLALKDKSIKEAELNKQKFFRNTIIIGAILLMIVLLLSFNNAILRIKKRQPVG